MRVYNTDLANSWPTIAYKTNFTWAPLLQVFNWNY